MERGGGGRGRGGGGGGGGERVQKEACCKEVGWRPMTFSLSPALFERLQGPFNTLRYLRHPIHKIPPSFPRGAPKTQ